MGPQNLTRAQIGDADAVLDLFRLLFTTGQAAARSHQELVLETLLLRHQLAVLTRPTRSRPQARLRLRDKLGWILVGHHDAARELFAASQLERIP